jgi:hypothetical protein
VLSDADFFQLCPLHIGSRLFVTKTESAMPDKSVNAGQILANVGEAKNWLYTKYLLKHMRTSG